MKRSLPLSLSLSFALAWTTPAARACEVLVIGGTIPPALSETLDATGYRVDYATSLPSNLRDTTYRVVIVTADAQYFSGLHGVLDEYATRSAPSGIILEGAWFPQPSWSCAADQSCTYVWDATTSCATVGSNAQTVATADNHAGLPSGTMLSDCHFSFGYCAPQYRNSTTAFQINGVATVDAVVRVDGRAAAIHCEPSSRLRVANMGVFPSWVDDTPALRRLFLANIEYCAFGGPDIHACGGGTASGCDHTPVLDAIDDLANRPCSDPCDPSQVLARIQTVINMLNTATSAACDLAPVTAAVDRLDARLTQVQGDVTTLRTAAADLRAAVQAVQTRLDATSARLGSVEAAVTANGARLGELETSVDAASARLGALDASVAAFGASLDANTARLGAVASSVDANTARLGGVESGLAANTSQLGALTSAVGDNTARLSAVEATAAEASRRIGVVDAKVDDALIRLQAIQEMLARLIGADCEIMRLVTTPAGQRSTDWCGGLDHRGGGH